MAKPPIILFLALLQTCHLVNGASNKYPKYVPIAKGAEVVDLKAGLTVGNFVPDSENGMKPVRIAVHVSYKRVQRMEAEEPIFGRELPTDRATEGSYTPEDRKGNKLPPWHGVLVPISKYRAYFIRDGTGYHAKFTPNDKSITPTDGFVVPFRGKKVAKQFYPESYMVDPFPGVKTAVVEAKVKCVVTGVEEEGRFIARRAGPSVFMVGMVGEEAEFQDKAKKMPAKRVIAIHKSKDSDKCEFYPTEQIIPDGTAPVEGTLKTQKANYDVFAVANDIADELQLKSEFKLELIKITTTDNDVNNVKAYALFPPDQTGPPMVDTMLTVVEGEDSLPPRIQVTLTMSDGSTAVGLLVADSRRGPHTFHPGMSNPSPAAKKEDDVAGPSKGRAVKKP